MIVEQDLFIKFCQSFNPQFRLVTVKTIKTNLVKSYINFKPMISAYLTKPGNGKLSFSTDLWSSPQNKAIMPITGTFLTSDFKMTEISPSLRELLGSHTGENICSMFLDVLHEYNLRNKVMLIYILKLY